jgi:hypothetical protein
MSWQDINLQSINPNLDIIPAKKYTFEILNGAKFDDRNPDNVSVSVAIAEDGEFRGRRLYATYAPEDAKALKRLSVAIGIDFEENEGPVDYLNRVAGSRFTTNVTHSKPNDQYPNPKAFLNKWNPSPAA